MENRIQLLKLCNKIVGVICILFMLIDLLDRAYVKALILLICSLVLLTPVFFGINKIKEVFLCNYFCIGLNILIFVVTTIERDYIACIPLFICAGTISSIFYDTKLVKVSFLFAIIFFIIEISVLSFISGSMVLEFFVILECVLAIATCFFLVYYCVNSGLLHMNKSLENEARSHDLLSTVNQQIEEEKISSAKSQHLLKEICQISVNILSEADKLTEGSASLAAGATEQTYLVEQLNEAIQTVSSKITEMNDYAKMVREESEEMNVNVDTGSQKMNDMLTAMEEIHKSSLSIEKIIKAIESISFQTNILSLNAAIETSRAGAAGKGFAVVAEEVRHLAAQSSEAVKNTTELLSVCLNAINNGSKIATETALELEHIGGSVNEVSSKTFMISDMINTQSSMVEEINQRIGKVSDVIQSIENTARETEMTGIEFQKQAGNLDKLSKSI